MHAKERPMLYSTDMVVSILEDRKTKTRRMRGLEEVNEHPDMWKLDSVGTMDWETYDGKPHPENKPVYEAMFLSTGDKELRSIQCPYGQPGDILWVRETFWHSVHDWNWSEVIYKANEPGTHPINGWKPSIHMPKVAARIWLQITDITVQRLQHIDEEDAYWEGVEHFGDGEFRDYTGTVKSLPGAFWSFNSLWCKINGEDSWYLDPWVWVISFKVLSKTGRPATIDTTGKEVAHV